jgi:uncharacterized protein YciI
MHYLLFYDYVENAVERRAPFRAEHLRLAQEALGRGELLMGGARAPTTTVQGRMRQRVTTPLVT